MYPETKYITVSVRIDEKQSNALMHIMNYIEWKSQAGYGSCTQAEAIRYAIGITSATIKSANEMAKSPSG